MNKRTHRLLESLAKVALGPPADLAAFLAGLPEPGALPSPWEAWTLIGLVRHRERQRWVADVVRNRLRGEPVDLAGLGALGHPAEARQSGSVPGLPEWEYFFHGRGCCLTHKVDGDQIDVDFWDDSPEYIDTFFYTQYLESLRRPEPPERRLLELHRSTRPVRINVDALIAAGALAPLPGRDAHPPRVADAVLHYADAISAFCRGWADPDNRAWLAGLCGDWLAAEDATRGGAAGIARIVVPRAGQCRRIRRDRLLQATGHAAADALLGLAELGAADEVVRQALGGPPTGLVSAALDVVEGQDDPKWCELLYAMFLRGDPAGPSPAPRVWTRALKFLLRHGHRRDELLAALPRAGGTEAGEAVLLALEHAPGLALPLIRKGLLSDIPVTRTEVAAILAVVARPWSVQELLGALDASDEQERTADVRAALLECGDESAQRAVLAWEERNPHENETGRYVEVRGRTLGPFYTFGEMALKESAARIRYEMDRLYDRVITVRDVSPGD